MPPFTTVQIDMYGECDASRPDVNIDDVWLTAWTTPTSPGQAGWTRMTTPAPATTRSSTSNGGPTQQEFLVRASTCCSTPTGPYRIRVSLFGGGGYGLRAWEPGDLPLKEKLAALKSRASTP
ncbi:MAG: hypothetical protein IPG05_03660 [Gemmatimonadetes bacterium]|nr:hypothetical protein [Gemmatimonadota bacterium]